MGLQQALSHLRVLDLSRILTGPYCTMMLADFGARVIKVENPGSGDDTRQWGPPFVNGESTYFMSVNRNKESITLNLKHPEAKKIFFALLDQADVLVENFRPGTMEKLGLGYEVLKQRNPRLIYAAVSGFGLTGPYADKPGYDVLAQAMGGTIAATGLEGGPPVKVGLSVADIGAGMFLAFGIMTALQARAVTGQGQLVDTSLFESQLAWHTYQATAHFTTGKEPRRLGTAHPSLAPYQAIKTQDSHIIVAVGNDQLWQKFCPAIGLPELAADSRFATNPDRVKNRDTLISLLEQHLQQETSATWQAKLDQVGVPAGPIYSFQEAWNDPQTIARDMVVEMEHPVAGPIKLPGVPVKLSATPGGVRTAPPTLGQHTDSVLAELGYTHEQIADLRAAGAI